jgi:hypothetical protein
MELLESVGPRPRQARYRAALRPDMECCIESKALSNFVAVEIPFSAGQLFHRVRGNGDALTNTADALKPAVH